MDLPKDFNFNPGFATEKSIEKDFDGKGDENATYPFPKEDANVEALETSVEPPPDEPRAKIARAVNTARRDSMFRKGRDELAKRTRTLQVQEAVKGRIGAAKEIG
ncbi:MAG: hypothetical protein LBL52_04020 [Rickettsiales bacterium]|jgi:hypothetical protein|nr:hypothetical protein [Rickettsiales bacterium]